MHCLPLDNYSILNTSNVMTTCTLHLPRYFLLSTDTGDHYQWRRSINRFWQGSLRKVVLGAQQQLHVERCQVAVFRNNLRRPLTGQLVGPLLILLVHLAKVRRLDAVERFDEPAGESRRKLRIAVPNCSIQMHRETEFVLLGGLLLLSLATAAFVLLAASDLFEAKVKQGLVELAGHNEGLVLISFVGTSVRFDLKQ